jgi:DNA gyrase subunit A
VDKGQLEETIGQIIEAKQVPQLLGLTNETNEKEGLRIVLEIKPDTDPNLVMAYLYKHTELQKTYSYNVTCLVPGPGGKVLVPKDKMSLRDLLREFLDFRFATVRRRFEYQLRVLRKRIHILEGFKIIFNALDKAIKLIRESQGKQDAAEKLMAAFDLDEEQTAAILDSQLYKIAQLEIKKILEELREKKKEAEEIEAILQSKRRLWGVIKAELLKLDEQFGERRKTRMAGDDDVLEFDPEAYIVRENTNVVLTRDGWIKRVGKLASVESTRVREGDEVIAVVPSSTLDNVIFFADDGTAYTMRVNEVPASSGYGEPAAKFFKLGDRVKVIAAVATDPRFTPPDQPAKKDVPGGPYLLVATSGGNILRTPLAAFREESTRAGRRYVRLDEGDTAVMVKLLRDEDGVMLASKQGYLIHFPLEEVNILAGVGKGVMGIKLDADDACIGGAVLGKSRFDGIELETSNGKTQKYGREARPPVHRGGKGYEVVRRLTLTRVIPPPIELVNWEDIEAKPANGKRELRLFE